VTADDLRALPIFSGVSDEALARLDTCAQIELEPGQVLVLPGDPGSGMFVVLDGVVDVELADGPDSVGRGGVIGELALLLEDSVRVARARAATDVRCLCVPRDAFLTLVETEPTFSLALLRVLAERLHAANAS
jgi:CRP-like cAMP-binding protein